MIPFVYTAHPARVIFGVGTFSQLPAELVRLNITRPLILSTPEQKHHADAVQSLLLAPSTLTSHPSLKSGPAGQFNRATMHTPMEITLIAMKLLKEASADGLVAIGGGSTTGLAKALALNTDLPQVIIPTTYAGSEMTPILGQTANGKKETISSLKVLPETVIYDVEFTMNLPLGLTAYSGMNAIAHAVEALYAEKRNPIVDMMAIEGIKSLVVSLPTILSSLPSQSSSSPSASLVEARSKALYGAWLCAVCLSLVGMSLHHKLCHTLGGSFDLPHAEIHTILIPHTMAYNYSGLDEDVKEKFRKAFCTGEDDDPIQSVNKLMDALASHGIFRGLKQLPSFSASPTPKTLDIDLAAELATKNPYWNPRPIEKDGIRELIRRAWEGETARADL